MPYKFNPFTGNLDSEGPVLTGTGTVSAAADGTAALPGIAFASDLNTGIYRPGADQLALATNGTGRLFVDSSGRVGINGVPASWYLDHLAPANTVARFRTTIAGDAFVRINSADNEDAAIQFGGSTSAFSQQIVSRDGDKAFLFLTNGIERLRITSDGTFQHRGAGTTGSPGSPAVGFNGSAPSNSLVVDSSGRLGVGTSAPEAKLTVANGAIQLKGTTYTDFSDYWGNGDNQAIFMPYGYLGSNGAFAVSLYCNGYRNDSSGFTYLGIDGNTSTACGIDLEPDGNIIFRSGTASGIALPPRMLIDPSGVVEISGNVEINGNLSIVDKITHVGDTNTAIRFPANDEFSIETDGSERLRVDTAGRLLKGASSSIETHNTLAGVQIHATSTSNGASLSLARFNNDAGSAQLILSKSRNSTVAPGTVVQANDSLGLIVFVGDDGTDLNSSAARIEAEVDGTPGANDMPGRLVFSTTESGNSSPTERMRIDKSGNCSYATPDDFAGIIAGSANGKAIGGVANSGVMWSGRNVTTAASHIIFSNPNGTVGQISTSASATSYNTSSDYRLKENVAPLTGAADRLNQLQVHRFNFIADPDTTVDGFIAHEAQAVVPECVTGTKDEVDDEGNPVYQGIDQSKLVPLLTAALQEAIGRIETLEAKVAALEAS